MVTRTDLSQKTSTLRKLARLPVSRILIGMVFVFIGIAIAQLVIGILGTSVNTTVMSVLSIVIAVSTVYSMYRLYVQIVEKRVATELSLDKSITELGSGLLTGSVILATVMGILWMLGRYHVSGVNSWLVLFPALAGNIPSGFVQEILFRGILFRITEESLGRWIALILCTVLFGLVHIFSANATPFSVLATMLEAGILLTAAYMLTKRLWLAIGIHIAWDFAIDGIFGVGTAALSDQPIPGLFQASLSGHDLISGGIQGVEASIVAILVSLAAGYFILWLAFHSEKQKRERA